MQLFVGVGGVCGARYFGMKKGLRNTEGLCIHDGGDEGDRTPDLLTASQAGTKLDRTQQAVGLLRFDTQAIKCTLELHQCK